MMMVTAAMMLFFLMMVMAAAMMLFLIVMMVAAAVVLLFMMMVTTAVMLFFMMMMMVVMVLFFHPGKLCFHRSLTFHSAKQLPAGQFIPRCGNNGGIGVLLPQECYSRIQLLLADTIGAGKDNGCSGLHLVIVELTKVLHISLHLAGIHDRNGKAHFHLRTGNLFHSSHHIGKLANTGRLDKDSFGGILGNDLLQSLTEVAHQAAANTAGIHFRDVDACILQKAAINADLAEFVFDQHQFLACVGFRDHLFDEGSFTCTKEAGVNINFCHSITPSKSKFFLL